MPDTGRVFQMLIKVMTGFLFSEDREKYERDRKKIERSKIFGTPEFRQAYRDYINSTAWKKLCEKVRHRSGNQCERCSQYFTHLKIHHLTYERFQHELLSDLQALCNGCHQVADREREQQNRKKFLQAGQEARYENARNTCLTKKYGEEWYMYDGNEYMYDEFDSWLERKNEYEW